jgi:L-histidine N-alpha-methyltransferase
VHFAEIGFRARFAEGEDLRTEISAKFTRERLEGDLHAAGLELRELYTDPDGLFGLSLSAPRYGSRP